MHTRTLRTFVEVIRLRGFSAAALAVNATQSTVSKAIKQLEDEVGAPLIDRVRMTPTEAGKIAYRHAVTILSQHEDMRRELAELHELARGELRLGISPIGGSTLFAPLFAIYRRRFPGVDIRLQEHGSKRLEELLTNGEVELAASLLPVGSEFAFQPVRSEPMVAILPPDHPAKGKSRVTLEDIGNSPIILFDTAFAVNRLVIDAYRRKGLQPQIAARSGQMDFMVELVAANVGVTFLPRTMAATHPHPAVHTAILNEPNTAWQLALVWRKTAYLSSAARAWLSLSHEVYSTITP